MDLTSPLLGGALVVATLAGALAIVFGPHRVGRHAPRWSVTSWRWRARPGPRTGWQAGRRLGAVIGVQVLAVLTAFVLVNTQLRLFVTTEDLVGRPARVAVEEVPLRPPGGEAGVRMPSGARLVTIDVHGAASGARAPVLVWLPPGYDDALRDHELPVLYFMPGQPGHPQGMVEQFEIDRRASEAIRTGAAKPFIVVLPPIMVAPPRSTECLDLPGGPQTRAWLVDDVGRAVSQRFRTSKDRRLWNLSGWSTGGYCAAKLLFDHRDRFGAAVSIGGYFHAWSDASTGDLFGGDPQRQRAADLLARLRNEPPVPTRLLTVTSRGDPASWGGHGSEADTERALVETARWPGTASIVLDHGGHTPHTYLEAFSESLRWLGRVNDL